ncbi:MAG TPA: hypothetical protein VF214_06620 [Edaphobacter sp.]
MKKAIEEDYEDMPSEIDFSGGVRGKYAGKIQPLNNLVLIDPELFKAFPSEEAVNDALRILLKAGAQAVKTKHKKAS